MKKESKYKWIKYLLFIAVFYLAIYGASRVYFFLTDGFLISNITSHFPYDSRWETRPLSDDEQKLVDRVLNQQFKYLGKGCQSYVFESSDGNYVIKFFKYQRYRPSVVLNYLHFVPLIESYQKAKISKKTAKRERFYKSWRTAFDHLKEESGLIYVHLNKTNHLKKDLVIYDKMGFQHSLNMDEMEFLIQKKAEMICSVLNENKEKQAIDESRRLLANLVIFFHQEYQKGLGDQDQALMQNTGILNGSPMHIDVGQIVKDDQLAVPEVYKQEMYNKMYKFRLWLKEHHSDYLDYLDSTLREEFGNEFLELPFVPRR